MMNKPYSDTRLAKYLQKRLAALAPRKSQKEIATEAGFRNPNVLSMIKTGDSRLPMGRVPALAKALEIESFVLARLALEQGEDETEKTLLSIFRSPVTANELEILEAIREASGHADPPLSRIGRKVIYGLFEGNMAHD